MGGRRSGRYRRYSKKKTVDELICLSINSFRKRGRWKFLNGTATWRRGDKVTARIGYIISGDNLDFQWRNEDGTVAGQSVPLTVVRQFIGKRYLFICPRCKRRVVNLYVGRFFYAGIAMTSHTRVARNLTQDFTACLGFRINSTVTCSRLWNMRGNSEEKRGLGKGCSEG